MSTPNSLTIPSRHLPPLATANLFFKSVSLFLDYSLFKPKLSGEEINGFRDIVTTVLILLIFEIKTCVQQVFTC